MKLKNRFLSIIIGTILVPPIVSFCLMLLIAPEFVTIGQHVHWKMERFFDDITDETSLEEVKRNAVDFPDKFFILVFDDNNRIIYRRDSANKNDLFLDETTKQYIISRRVTFDDGNQYTILIGSGLVMQYRSFLDMIVMASILIFLIVISYLTVRSINKSIVKLEEGTKRIAEGDLDTPVVLYGDDTFISLANSINTMRKKIKEEHDRRTRFFTGVSHDLKTPLASITGYSEALLDGLAEDYDTRDKYLRIINAKGKLLERRIVKLIQYIKLTNKDFQSNLKHQLLVPFLEDFIDLQRDEAALNGYTFDAEVNIDRDTVIPFDQDLMLRAMENLMQNSYRYGDTSKSVRLLCHYKEDAIYLAFVNHHTKPISKEVVKHIFEPFYRGDQARKGEGFGLGLASVKSIVESHGWQTEVRSVESEGITIFQIIIPRAQEQQKALPGRGIKG